ncbi:hypothetical protein LCAC16_150384 [Leuconostoc carnosum]|nr:hypothetical protein LCAC16_150384 [Leuconostoc carnosum]
MILSSRYAYALYTNVLLGSEYLSFQIIFVYFIISLMILLKYGI